MRGDEARVVAAFVRHLEAEGWNVRTEVDHVDVVAMRSGHTLYAEAKGRTSSVGLDIDTMFGQILRRMPLDDQEDNSFAVVVPREAVNAVKRVPERIRRLLRLSIFSVDSDGCVEPVE